MPTTAAEPDARLAALLTARSEAVHLVAEGLSNEEIAERWVVSNATVRTHVSRAMTKLNARDRAQLVVFAYRAGLASIPGRTRPATTVDRTGRPPVKVGRRAVPERPSNI